MLLLTAVGAVFMWLFQFGWAGIAIALGVAIAMAVGSYWNSDKVALAVTRARPADPETYARLHNLVEGLCIATGLPKPRLYVIDDPAPNAFATGRDPKHAAIAVTSGLLEKMNRIELEGVLAHELSHIKNYDILVSTLAVIMVGAIALISDLGIRFFVFGGRRNDHQGSAGGLIALISLVFIALAPLAATLMQFAVSRRRESLADMSAVEITRYPPGLIAALEKLRDDHTVVRENNRATAHLWIEEPMPQYEGENRRKHRWSHLFDTHPPIEERIAALREL
ncbi:M48 family metallopeptidase [Rhabdothermincola sediminis]|uniref:M48 family metallopeptidase n=1 Tax=Rhabdothermincola sediminis TaxID=2751370 RepID=UPI0027DA158A|nr:M48 family metallopeptidase [Rhabdothermincola sediminis]